MRAPGASALLAAVLTFLVVLLAAGAPADAADEPIGSIKTVRGSASVLRGGEAIPARTGLKLLAGDTLETGTDGALGLILRDDSLLSLGPSSRVAVERFLFAPAEGQLGLTARVLRGTLTYLSGIIGRLAPEATTFVTPVATIGVRGTHFAVQVEE